MSPELLSQFQPLDAFGLSALALICGSAVAQISGPLACSWPAAGRAMLARLRAVRLYRRLSPGRVAAGAVLLAALLGAGTLGAYAAAPPAATVAAAPWIPMQLPAEVEGVVGSGDQLALRVKADGAERVVRPGETYRDGWVLQALSPSEATLSLNGQSVRVGLNPAGALAAGAPSTGAEVTVQLSEADRALLARLQASGTWNGQAMRGLTLEQTQRAVLNTARLTEAYRAKLASGADTGFVGLSAEEVRATIGQAAFDQQVAMSRSLINQGLGQLPFTRPTMGLAYDIRPDGVAVTGVFPGGAAERHGMKAGDLIVQVNGVDAVAHTRWREGGDNILSTDPLAYTLSTGKVVTVRPDAYFP